MQIVVKETREEAQKEVANIIASLVKEKSDAVIGLAGGRTMKGVFEELVSEQKENGTDYSGVETLLVDEYVGLLETDLYRTFSFQIEEELTNKIKFKASYAPKYYTNHPDKEAKRYQELYLSKNPDLQILGLGQNGHIAFNEPKTPLDSEAHVARLSSLTRVAHSDMFNNKVDIVPTHAITLGLKDILTAKKIVLIACGVTKQAAIKALVLGDVSPELPVSVLKKHPDCIIVLDKEAAKLL